VPLSLRFVATSRSTPTCPQVCCLSSLCFVLQVMLDDNNEFYLICLKKLDDNNKLQPLARHHLFFLVCFFLINCFMWFALFIGGGKEAHIIYVKRRHNLRGRECHHQVSDNGLQVSLFFFLFILGMHKKKTRDEEKKKIKEEEEEKRGKRIFKIRRPKLFFRSFFFVKENLFCGFSTSFEFFLLSFSWYFFPTYFLFVLIIGKELLSSSIFKMIMCHKKATYT
jgi:hypothetical protein